MFFLTWFFSRKTYKIYLFEYYDCFTTGIFMSIIIGNCDYTLYTQWSADTSIVIFKIEIKIIDLAILIHKILNLAAEVFTASHDFRKSWSYKITRNITYIWSYITKQCYKNIHSITVPDRLVLSNQLTAALACYRT